LDSVPDRIPASLTWWFQKRFFLPKFKMATSYIGGVGPFKPEVETFESYMERLDMFFLANNIVETQAVEGEAAAVTEAREVVKTRKKAIFLSEVGPEVYGILSNLVAPQKPRDLTLAQIKVHLKGHFNPDPLEISESFHFGTRVQKNGESVNDFVLALKKLSIHCNFENYLDRALRDRLVCGLQDTRIQNKLLNTTDLTFERACRIANAMEMADKQAKEMRPQSHSGSVNKVNQGTGSAGESKNFESKKSRNKSSKGCFRCGHNHLARDCPMKDAQCYKCKKIGHMANMCRTKLAGKPKDSYKPKNDQPRSVSQVEHETDDSLGIFSIMSLSGGQGYFVKMTLNDIECNMQIDTAADFSVMSKQVYRSMFSHMPMSSSKVKLKTYTGDKIVVCGEIMFDVVYKDQKATLPMVVVDHPGRPTLLGRNWLEKLKLEWGEIFTVTQSSKTSSVHQRLDLVLRKHSALFQENDNYDGLTNFKAHIRVKPDAKPVFLKARRVPYALKDMVEAELDKLEKNKVIVKTDYSEWASPVVVVPKSDHTVRICGDYKVSINSVVDDEQYNLPTTQDLYHELAGSKVFTKLDLSHAYAQLEVESESQKYLTINTHKGLYRYTKLPYGVKSSPKIFQRVMDQILQGIPKCVCKQDDILIGGDTEHENLELLTRVLGKLADENVHLKLAKCDFLKPKVVYLGLEFSKDGLRPVESKVEAVKQAPVPENVSQLRSFLGMVQYYHQFLPNLATYLEPLHNLLKKSVIWKWSAECQKAFDFCKDALTSDSLLVHYDSKKKLKLACDASSYGVGAVLSHELENGEERPIAYASRTINKTERNYSQIEREALALIFGVKKFHDYIYGRKLVLVTDHKPLLAIFGEKSQVPTLAAARMQRWALILTAYDYTIEFRKSEAHANCDALSRLPNPKPSTAGMDNGTYCVNLIDEGFPLLATEIAKATKVNPTLVKVYQYIMSGWPGHCPDDDLMVYFKKKEELSCEQGCILWGQRVVIPPKFKKRMLDELHWQHPGICSMKALARSYVWWPNIDNDIESMVHGCTVCQNTRQTPAKVPLHPWKWPTRPFQRVHVDFCESDKQCYLILIDSHSKWVDVKPMSSTTAEKTIDELRLIFAEHGLPESLVSDNGPPFTSAVFSEFLEKNGIRQILVAPYHAASNGAAERAVKLFKEAFTKQVIEGVRSMSLKHRIANFLFKYRSTPHSTTGVSPAELMTKRQFRTRMSLVKPNLSDHVEKRQASQKLQYDKSKVDRGFDVGDIVRVKNLRAQSRTERWHTGSIIGVQGPRNYLVKIGRVTRLVHADHLMYASDLNAKICIPDTFTESHSDESEPEPSQSVVVDPVVPLEVEEPLAVGETGHDDSCTENHAPVIDSPVVKPNVTPALRRSTRIRKPVVKFNI
jgi:transposase InsO family protein